MALLQCNFFSQALMRTVPIQVVLPTDKTLGPGGPAAQGPFKTLYLLHGIFGNDTDWVCGTRVQSWAQDRNLAVVMPSGDNSFYVDNPKASAYYGRFIGQELVDFTRRSFPLSTRREDTFLGGLSMGGFGAIVNGLQHPQTFGAVAALSSALILDSMLEHTQYTDFLMTNKGYYESVFGELSQVRGGVNDYDALAEKVAKEPVRPKFYLACGTEDGLLADRVQLYGMEPFALGYLTILDGEISKLNDPNGNYIAAVYSEDDYGNPVVDSHWAKLGDKVTIRYVEEFEYYNPINGEVYGSWENVPEGAAYADRAVKYRDVDYTVAALVAVPTALSYRYYGADEFIMGAETFIRDTGTDSVMYYAFDTTDEANSAMESFLSDYTGNVNPQYDYESKATYAGEFKSTRNMFLLLGSALSFIVGLVGILNFFNAILTGITARRRELAVLQSIGMTTRQLRTMLALEGLLYTLSAALLALVLVLVTAPFVAPTFNRLIWFFTYHFTIWPVAVLLPLFAVLGIVIPVITCRAAQRYSVVERLRVE